MKRPEGIEFWTHPADARIALPVIRISFAIFACYRNCINRRTKSARQQRQGSFRSRDQAVTTAHGFEARSADRPYCYCQTPRDPLCKKIDFGNVARYPCETHLINCFGD